MTPECRCTRLIEHMRNCIPGGWHALDKARRHIDAHNTARLMEVRTRKYRARRRRK